MRRAVIVFFGVVLSACAAAQTPVPPSMEEVFRDFPPNADASKFVSLALPLPPATGDSLSDRGLPEQNPVHGVYKVGRGVTAPRAVKSPDPHYSKEARKKGIEGRVVLWVIVRPDGVAHEIRVAKSLGYGLDEETIKAVRKWRFQPATKDGVPVAVQINIEVNYLLH